MSCMNCAYRINNHCEFHDDSIYDLYESCLNFEQINETAKRIKEYNTIDDEALENLEED